MTTDNVKRTTVYSCAHFLMDMLCAFLLFRFIRGSESWMVCLLLYNLCAFAGQMPIGIIADKLNRNRRIAAMGFLLATIVFAVYSVHGFVTASETVQRGPVAGSELIAIASSIIMGIGNAMFHVGGGLEILNQSVKKESMKGCSALGVFVSPGAFGLYLGTMLGKSSIGVGEAYIALIAAIVAAAAYFGIMRFRMADTVNTAFPDKNSHTGAEVSKAVILSLVCLFFVVALRSYMGMIQSFPWKAEYGLWCVAAVVLGKAAGGIASDMFGVRRTVCVSLTAAAILYIFCDAPAFGIAAVFLFQMTMPITLKGAAAYLGGLKGFAFGLLTFALFIGFLVPYMGIELGLSSIWGYVGITVASLLLLLAGLWRLCRRNGRVEKERRQEL